MENPLPSVRRLGMMIAEIFSKIVQPDDPVKFDYESESEDALILGSSTIRDAGPKLNPNPTDKSSQSIQKSSQRVGPKKSACRSSPFLTWPPLAANPNVP
jgi:hypothetical protein